MFSAVREFNQYGYNWYPQVWVEAYKRWFDVQWVRHNNPAGFTTPQLAIAAAQE